MARILFLDDEFYGSVTSDDEPQGYMAYYVLALKEAGHHVRCCARNGDALEALGSDTYDIFLQDVMRPPEDLSFEDTEAGHRTGLVFLEEVRRRFPDLPTAFLTNSSHPAQPVAAPMFRKIDTTPNNLVDVVSSILDGSFQNAYDSALPDDETSSPILVSIKDELIAYFSKYPEKLYNLDPRKFEELVADLLRDMGLDVHLTPASRDGGVDIYAYVKHEVASFLMLVECKRWAADKAVGLPIVQRLYGVQQSQRANKSMIVTTSYFSSPAKEEAATYKGLMDLRDFEGLKSWLAKYTDTPETG